MTTFPSDRPRGSNQVKTSTKRIGIGLIASALLVTGCSSNASQSAESSQSAPSGTVTVWDYYGQATPLKKAIAEFKIAHPEITVNYQAFDYEALHSKFPVAVASGQAPDLATIDMTWVPSFAANGLLSDINSISGGSLNGSPIAGQYTAGANAAMTFDGKLVTALYDFDAYSLYYRKDILDAKGIAVPTTWDELISASNKMAERPSAGAKPTKYAFAVQPDTFHYATYLIQNGGSILDSTNSKAAFNEAAGVGALDYWKSLLSKGGGLYWPDPSTLTAGVKSEQIGMFMNGPYMMGVLKAGVPEQSGKWAVAAAPVGKQQGSYLGGTGLVIPKGAKNPSAAWVLAQWLLQPKEQQYVFTEAGAAPATSAALELPVLSAPDPYFGGQAAFSIFKDAMATAVHYPYVAAWGDIDSAITDAVTAVLIGKDKSQSALDAAAKLADTALGH